MIDCQGSHVEQEIMLRGVRSDVADPISYRQLEELMPEHGMAVDHAILTRWVITYVPSSKARERGLPGGRERTGEIIVQKNACSLRDPSKIAPE